MMQDTSAVSPSHTGAPRILIVEDECLLALVLEEDLQLEGFDTVGPFGDLRAAEDACRKESFDLAVLDINLNGEPAFPLADALQARAIPFVFLSGYGPSRLPERFRGAPCLAKPCDARLLAAQISRLLRHAA